MKVQNVGVAVSYRHSVRIYTTSSRRESVGTIERRDLEWVMGLIEAEGYIGFNDNSGKGTDKEK